MWPQNFGKVPIGCMPSHLSPNQKLMKKSKNATPTKKSFYIGKNSHFLELQALVNGEIWRITGRYIISKFRIGPYWPHTRSYVSKSKIDGKNPKMLPPFWKRHLNKRKLTIFWNTSAFKSTDMVNHLPICGLQIPDRSRLAALHLIFSLTTLI